MVTDNNFEVIFMYLDVAVIAHAWMNLANAQIFSVKFIITLLHLETRHST